MEQAFRQLAISQFSFKKIICVCLKWNAVFQFLVQISKLKELHVLRLKGIYSNGPVHILNILIFDKANLTTYFKTNGYKVRQALKLFVLVT